MFQIKLNDTVFDFSTFKAPEIENLVGWRNYLNKFVERLKNTDGVESGQHGENLDTPIVGAQKDVPEVVKFKP